MQKCAANNVDYGTVLRNGSLTGKLPWLPNLAVLYDHRTEHPTKKSSLTVVAPKTDADLAHAYRLFRDGVAPLLGALRSAVFPECSSRSPTRSAARTSAARANRLEPLGACAKIAHMTAPSRETVEIGSRIALAREELGMTQADLAQHLNIDRTAVAKIEAGRRNISARELVKVAASLDRPIDWFVVESPPAVVSRRQDPAAGGLSQVLDRRIDRLARDVEFLEAAGVLPAIDVPKWRSPTAPTRLRRPPARFSR